MSLSTHAKKTADSAEFRSSRLLLGAGFRHAFFARGGGVSAGEFSSLNFSVAVGDAPDNVRENLERAGAVLGVRELDILFLSQVHGNAVCRLGGSETRDETLRFEGDAIVARHPRRAAAVRTADCLPILVADRESGAVAAIHAGWKGLVAGVIGTGVAALAPGAVRPGQLVAAIGPHITVAAFEVSEEVAGQIAACGGGEGVVDRGRGPKPHVDLRHVARAQLLEAGLADDCIDVVAGCTASEPEHFFSYRRDGRRSGRHLAAIVPRS